MMTPTPLDYHSPPPRKRSLLAGVALLCGLAPFFLFCISEFWLFSDESPFNTFQDIAMTIGILGNPICAVVLGNLALRQIRRDHVFRGEGKAITAIVLGSFWILLITAGGLASLVKYYHLI